MRAYAASPGFGATLTDALAAAGPPLLFGVRLWVSVCLALYVAFWLQLDNPFWAGTSAAIVCQPQLGASLRKGWFRMIGTVIGAAAIVVLTAGFPQDRIAFLALLALWGGVCAFAATVLRNFASYAAALSGYTAVIIAADTLGATGGASPDVFLLAVTRGSEICIGIVCAGVVLAGTDLGGARRRLAASFADVMAEIAGRLTRMLALAGPHLPDTQAERRELLRRVIALDPMIDQALGESSDLRYHSPILQAAVHGLLGALEGCRAVATHLGRLREDRDHSGADTILRSMPAGLREPAVAERWMASPGALRGACEAGGRALLALPAATPSLRLLVDETAKMLDSLSRALDGLGLLVGAPTVPRPGHRGLRLSVPDWLPAVVNAARAIVAIGAAVLLWVVTGWPNGAFAIVFVSIVVLLLSPRGDLAYATALVFALGVAVDVPCAAIMDFAVLPAYQTFPALCLAIGLFLVPAGFALARSRRPVTIAAFSAMSFIFMPLLAPTNQMSYDTVQFYNSSLSIVVGCFVAPLAFCLMPPLSPAVRARRLLALTLRDLRRLAIARRLPSVENWEIRLYGRLAALPDQAEPLQRAQLLAALSVGTGIIHLRRMTPGLGAQTELEAALAAFVQSNSAVAVARLARL
ncbi:MAG TPA: FUSC family protein, partial [Stellaceae bacterium]|nr:FUSC family protein [Stellaceae bacterium]